MGYEALQVIAFRALVGANSLDIHIFKVKVSHMTTYPPLYIRRLTPMCRIMHDDVIIPREILIHFVVVFMFSME